MHQIQLRQFGPAENLAQVELPSPEPGPGTVVVQMAAAGLNPIDYKTRQGLGWAAQALGERFCWTPGYDLAGIVTAVGEGVRSWQFGQRVCALVGFPQPAGAYSEQVVVAAEQLVAIPDGVSLEAAGALPVAGLTAWQALHQAAHLAAGQRLLILGAAGGVGHLAVQLAKLAGARVVGTASSANAGFVAELGADQVLDYQQAGAFHSLEPVDLVLDLVGGPVGEQAVQHLKPGGLVVTIPTVTANAVIAAAEHHGARGTGMLVTPDNEQLRQLLALLARGELQVTIAERFPLAEVVHAHQKLEQGHGRGKRILIP